MTNPEERAICKRRSHDAGISISLKTGWVRCKWCSMWIRELVTLEERVDTPPEDEISPHAKLRRLSEL